MLINVQNQPRNVNAVRQTQPIQRYRAITTRGLALAATICAPFAMAHAAALAGISMPDTRSVDGRQMQLNGIGLRTYSILGVKIYVAGLYLERRSDNPDAIRRSPETKMLDIRFLRDVGAADARQAWREGFDSNCKAPCYLDPGDVQRFLAAVPDVHSGDESTLLFTPQGVQITMNGRPAGQIADPHFADAMLATFIGPEPPTPRLKRELLGFRN